MDARSVRDALLYPETVALIGASDSPAKLTARPQRFLDAHGFPGAVYPVNPRRDTVLGRPAYRSVADLPGAIDHAYILLDADAALAALEDCARAGVKVVSVLADGFAESGPEGAARQARLVDIARAADMLVIGPNSMGVVETGRGFACTTNAAFRVDSLGAGRHAVLSQSGSMIGAILSRGAAVGIGFGVFVSLGNEAAVGVGELGAALVDDPAIDGFVLFLETIRRPEAVADFAARAHAAGKTVTAYLVGRSEAGSALAVSHTGALAGGARAIESFLEAQGIVVTQSFEALIELPRARALAPRLAGRPRTATVVTTTGGGGGMVYDLLGLRGVALAGMADQAVGELARAGLDVKPGPLVDVTLAGARYETMKAVMTALMTDPATGLVVAAIGSSAQFDPELAVRPIVDARRELGDDAAPVVAVPLPEAGDSLRLLNAGGVPAFRTVESCAESVAALVRGRPAPERFAARPGEPARAAVAACAAGVVDEMRAGGIFEALGVPRPPTLLLAPGAPFPERLPFAGPYVVKAVSPDVAHKSDIGAVAVGPADRAAAAEAAVTVCAALGRGAPQARSGGVLVQQLMRGLGEAIVGFSRDPVVGPMVTVGVGGVLSEIYGDVATHPAPVSTERARAMIDAVKGFAPLGGYRGGARGDLDALAAVVAALSTLAAEPRVEEAEINPVLVRGEGQGVVALDALVRLGE